MNKESNDASSNPTADEHLPVAGEVSEDDRDDVEETIE